MSENKKMLSVKLKAVDIVGLAHQAIAKGEETVDIPFWDNSEAREDNPQRPSYRSVHGGVWVNKIKDKVETHDMSGDDL